MLCTNTFIFLQMLEGGRKEVSETYNRIASDLRIRTFSCCTFEEIMSRRSLTGQWAKSAFDRLNMAVLLKHRAGGARPYACRARCRSP